MKSKHNFPTGHITIHGIEVIGKPFKGTGKFCKKQRGQIQCKCHCGSIFIADLYRLADNRLKSCGCLLKTRLKNRKTGTNDISGSYWAEIYGGRNRRSKTIPFTITIEQAQQLLEDQQYKCGLTGKSITAKREWDPFTRKYTRGTASLDRIDSNLGYEPNNIMWLHRDVNKMKMDLPLNQFVLRCKEVAEYQQKKEP